MTPGSPDFEFWREANLFRTNWLRCRMATLSSTHSIRSTSVGLRLLDGFITPTERLAAIGMPVWTYTSLRIIPTCDRTVAKAKPTMAYM